MLVIPDVSITVPSYSIPHELSYVFPDELEHVVDSLGAAQRSEVLVGHGGAVAVWVRAGLRDVLSYTDPVLDVMEPSCELAELIADEVIIPPDDAGEVDIETAGDVVDITTAGVEVDIPAAVDNVVDDVDIPTADDELDTAAAADDVLPGCVEDVGRLLDIAFELIIVLVWLDCDDDEVPEPPLTMDKSTAASTPGLDELL